MLVSPKETSLGNPAVNGIKMECRSVPVAQQWRGIPLATARCSHRVSQTAGANRWAPRSFAITAPAKGGGSWLLGSGCFRTMPSTPMAREVCLVKCAKETGSKTTLATEAPEKGNGKLTPGINLGMRGGATPRLLAVSGVWARKASLERAGSISELEKPDPCDCAPGAQEL
eukprot:scaffold3181_cov389-Prasinococcus_capsulatus_cf.AAC.19